MSRRQHSLLACQGCSLQKHHCMCCPLDHLFIKIVQSSEIWWLAIEIQTGSVPSAQGYVHCAYHIAYLKLPIDQGTPKVDRSLLLKSISLFGWDPKIKQMDLSRNHFLAWWVRGCNKRERNSPYLIPLYTLPSTSEFLCHIRRSIVLKCLCTQIYINSVHMQWEARGCWRWRCGAIRESSVNVQWCVFCQRFGNHFILCMHTHTHKSPKMAEWQKS